MQIVVVTGVGKQAPGAASRERDESSNLPTQGHRAAVRRDRNGLVGVARIADFRPTSPRQAHGTPIDTAIRRLKYPAEKIANGIRSHGVHDLRVTGAGGNRRST